MKYYGVMVCLLDGSLKNLEGNFDYKPAKEEAGWFGFAMWSKTREERDKNRKYLINYIKEYREAHKDWKRERG